MNITELPIEKINPNSYNPNILTDKLFIQLKKTIAEYGFLQPVVVTREEGTDNYIIIDGEHRYLACKELEQKTVSCLIIESDKFTSMIQTISINRFRGNLDSTKMGEIITFLRKTYSISELMNKLGIEEADLRSYEELGGFDLNNLNHGTSSDVIVPSEGDSPLDDINIFKITLDNDDLVLLEECLKKVGGKRKDAFVTICKKFLAKNSPEKLKQVVDVNKTIATLVTVDKPIVDSPL